MAVVVRRLARSPAALSLAASLSIQAVNVVTGIILARTLGPEDRGELAAIILWPSVLAGLGSLGIAASATYLTARGRTPGAVAGTACALAVLQSIVIVAVYAPLIPVVLNSYDRSARSPAYLFLAFVPLNLLTVYLLAVLNGLHQFRAYHLLRLLVIAVTGVGLIGLWATSSLGVRAAVGVYLGANLMTAVAAVVVVARATERFVLDARLGREMLGYGLRTHPSNVSLGLSARLDELAVSVVLGPVKLGQYVIAVTLTSLTAIVGQSFALNTLPRIAALAREEALATAQRIVAQTLILSVAVSAPIFVLAPWLIRMLFGDEFAPATDAARVLVIAAVILSVNRILGAVLQALGRPGDPSVAEMLGVIVMAAAIALLLPTLGLVGAALATTSAYVTSAAWNVRRSARALGISSGALLRGSLRFSTWLPSRLPLQ